MPTVNAGMRDNEYRQAHHQQSCPGNGIAAHQRSIMPAMYIIAIGWLYVTLLMAFTESSVVAGILSFVFYGLMPTALLFWLLGTKARRQRSTRVAGDQIADDPDRSDAKPDQ